MKTDLNSGGVHPPVSHYRLLIDDALMAVGSLWLLIKYALCNTCKSHVLRSQFLNIREVLEKYVLNGKKVSSTFEQRRVSRSRPVRCMSIGSLRLIKLW